MENYTKQSIQLAFEAQVQKNPHKLAVVYEGLRFTYEELNARINQISHLLRKYNLQSDDVVALVIDRSELTIISILAVLKAGAAYLPIDVSIPDQRLNYLLNDAKPKLVITNSIHQKRVEQVSEFSHVKPEIFTIDSLKGLELIAASPTLNPPNINKPSDLAYLIYTSGTTGNPKGVLIEHHSVLNLADAQSIPFGLYEGTIQKNCLFFANYTFDAHVSEFATCLLRGHALYIISDKTKKDLGLLNYYLIKNRIDIATIPPSMLDDENILQCKTLVLAGELTKSHIIKHYINNGVKLLNAYGPTESTVCATVCDDLASNKNIGTPIKNIQVYILNNNFELVKNTEIGEIYIGGEGLARGYHNNLALTNEKFLHIPILNCNGKESLTRVYKSGDLGRYNADGSIEFLGRADTQVKINGYRIELQEIENVLASHSDIKNCLVHWFEDTNGSKFLVAYIVADTTNTKTDSWLKRLDIEFSQASDNIGWINSYTNTPFSKSEMEDYFNSIASDILKYHPKNILEIGCGGGQILQKLINSLESYYATDFSQNAIKALQKDIDCMNLNSKVKTEICSADQIKSLFNQPEFDMVVLSSVIQYFPGAAYFEKVIQDMLLILIKPGIIYIGDVRDLRLRDSYYASILKNQNQDVTDENIINMRSNETEFFIDPRFFLQLQKKFTQIVAVEIKPKISKFSNELSKYRYNVTIHIGALKSQLRIQPLTEEYETIQTYGQIKEKILLNAQNFEFKFLSQQYLKTFSEIDRSSLNLNPLNIYEIEDILSKSSYNTSFYLDLEDSRFIIGVADKTFKPVRSMQLSLPHKDIKLYNEPAEFNLETNKSWQYLSKFLRTKLPDYYIPSFFIEIDKIPLTSHGKIDYSKLPNHENFIYQGQEDTGKQNLSDNHEALKKIWAEVLNINETKVGVNDSFFNLGGNSLLSIKLINKINKCLGTNLTTSTLYKYNSIDKLLFRIETEEEKERKEYIY